MKMTVKDTAYRLLSNEVLLSIRDSLRDMKKLGIHDGTAFEDINATKIYRKMKKFKQSDNESIMTCLSDEDKSDVLNFVPGARQAMQQYSDEKIPYSANSWHALLFALSSPTYEESQQEELTSSETTGWHMGSYMSNSFLNSLHEKLESLLIDQTVKKSVQIYAGQILGEGLLMFYPTSLARIKMFVNLLSQLDSGERLSSGQEVLLSYSLMLFTRRDIGKKTNTSPSSLGRNNFIASVYGCQLLLPTPTIRIKRLIIRSNEKENDTATFIGGPQNDIDLDVNKSDDKIVFECERHYSHDIKGRNKGGHSMMNHFVDLIRILSNLSSKNICELLSPEMLNDFNSFSASLQRESGRNLKIPTSVLSRIVEINGIPVASFTDAEKLSRIRDSSSPLLCKILENVIEKDDNGIPKFNKTLGFSDWVDVQDHEGRWWIAQIIGEKMETGNKFLQVKYTIDSSPPELDPSKTVKEKNDKSNNSDTGDDGERNNEENQQQHVSSTVLLDSIPRHSSGEPTYEFWWEYSNYSEDDVLEGWSPFNDDIAIIFEEAYCDREDSINIDIDDDHHVVDFINMTLTNVESGDECEIRRQDEYIAPDGYVNPEVLQPPPNEWICLTENRFAKCQSMVKSVNITEKRGDLKMRYEMLLPAIQAQLLYQASQYAHLRSTNNAPVTMLLRFCRLILDESIQVLDGLNVESDHKDQDPFASSCFCLLPSLYTSFFAFKRTPWLAESLLAPSVRLLRSIDIILVQDKEICIAERNYRDYERSSKMSTDMKNISRQTFDCSLSHNDFQFSQDATTCSVDSQSVDNQFRSAILSSSLGPMTKGVHSVTFRVDNENAGHIFFGVCTPQFIDSTSSHLGATDHHNQSQNSWAWLAHSRLRLFPDLPPGEKYGVCVKKDDIVTMTLDLDSGTLCYSVNDVSYGTAFGPGARPGRTQKLEGPLYFGVSIWHTERLTILECSTVSETICKVPYLLQLQKTIGNVCGFFAANLITGPPVCRDEEELRRWLEDPLFASGVESKRPFYDEDDCVTQNYDHDNVEDTSIWTDVYARECGGGLAAGGLRRQLSATPSKEKAPEAPSVLSPCLEFLYNFSDSKSGMANKLFQVLEKNFFLHISKIEKMIRKRLARVEHVESVFFAVLLKHSGDNAWQEAHTILQKDLHAGTDSIMPSARMMKLWDKLIQMRKWLRGVKSAFVNIDYNTMSASMKISNDILDHSRDQNNNSTDESKHSVDDERKDDDLDDGNDETEDGDGSGELLRPWEHRSSLRKEVPKSFDMLCKQIIKRAKFLLYLKQDKATSSSINGRQRGNSYNIHDVVGVRDEINNAVLATGSIQPLLSHYRPQLSKNKSFDQSEDEFTGTSAVSTCFEYIQDGFNAPPELLHELINIRRIRANQRIFGLQAAVQAVKCARFISVKNDILSWIRSGLRGMSSVEWNLESYEHYHRFSEDKGVLSSSYYRSLRASADARRAPGNSRYCFFKGLEWMQFFLVCSCKECGICTLPRDLSIVGSIIHQWICRELYTSAYVTPYVVY